MKASTVLVFIAFFAAVSAGTATKPSVKDNSSPMINPTTTMYNKCLDVDCLCHLMDEQLDDPSIKNEEEVLRYLITLNENPVCEPVTGVENCVRAADVVEDLRDDYIDFDTVYDYIWDEHELAER